MRIVRRVLSPIVVLACYIAGFYAMQALFGDTWSDLGNIAEKTKTFDSLLLWVVGVLAWACFAWLALGTVLMALSAIPGAIGRSCGAIAEKVTPAAYRRVAKFALGITLAAGPVLGSMPANAAPVDNPAQAAAAAQLPSLDRPGSIDSSVPNVAQLPSLDRPGSGNIQQGLPNPDRPLSTGTQAGSLANPDRPTTNDPLNRADRGIDDSRAIHVVKRGDTLWDIAKDRLPDGASASEVTREWHRWYDYNRQVIGGDPDLILPGQVLKAPPAGYGR